MANNLTYCNSTPFLSNRECDKGNVDIHQFDDFPYCTPICPSQTEAPPEIVDTPIVVNTPLTCSCINIDYDLSLKYENAFKGVGEFKSAGDCCDGNYKTDFEIKIPCPVSDSNNGVSIGIGYGDGSSSKEVPLIKSDCEACTIEPTTANIDLRIPCPVPSTNAEMSVGLTYGDTDGEPIEEDFIKARHDSCSMTINTPSFDLKLECPIKCPNSNVSINIGYGDDFNSISEQVVKTDCDKCSITAETVDFNLTIPCPILGTSNAALSVEHGWETNPQKESKNIFKSDADKCTIEPQDIDFNLTVPCPISGSDAIVSVGLTYGRERQTESHSVAYASKDSCSIEVSPANFNLTIPCPIDDLTGKVGFNLKYGNGENRQTRQVVAKKNYECSVNAVASNFDLSLPCPINGSAGKLHLESTYQDADNQFTLFSVDSCSINAPSVTALVSVPCTADRFHLSGGKISYGENPAVIVKDNSNGLCSKNYVIEAVFPKPSIAVNIDCPLIPGTATLASSLTYGDYADGEILLNAGCAVMANDALINFAASCPIENIGKIKAEASWGDGGASKTTLFRAYDCGAEFPDATIQINVPCPMNDLTLKNGGVLIDNGGNKVTVSKDSWSCGATYTVTAHVNDVSVGSPSCPITGNDVSISANASWGKPVASTPATILTIDKEKCQILSSDASFGLAIPCPITGTTNAKITVDPIAFGSGGAVTKPIYKKESGCSVAPLNASFSGLTISCPLDVLSISGGAVSSGTPKFVIDGKGNCNGANFSISANFPMPKDTCIIEGNGEGTITPKFSWGNNTTSASFDVLDVDSCSITPKSGNLSLQLKCPVGDDPASLTFSPSFGATSAGSIEILKASAEDCSITTSSGTITVGVPCPLDGLSISGGDFSISEDGSSGIIISETPSVECKKELSIFGKFQTLNTGECPTISSGVVSAVLVPAEQVDTLVRIKNCEATFVGAVPVYYPQYNNWIEWLGSEIPEIYYKVAYVPYSPTGSDTITREVIGEINKDCQLSLYNEQVTTVYVPCPTLEMSGGGLMVKSGAATGEIKATVEDGSGTCSKKVSFSGSLPDPNAESFSLNSQGGDCDDEGCREYIYYKFENETYSKCFRCEAQNNPTVPNGGGSVGPITVNFNLGDKDKSDTQPIVKIDTKKCSFTSGATFNVSLRDPALDFNVTLQLGDVGDTGITSIPIKIDGCKQTHTTPVKVNVPKPTLSTTEFKFIDYNDDKSRLEVGAVTGFHLYCLTSDLDEKGRPKTIRAKLTRNTFYMMSIPSNE